MSLALSAPGTLSPVADKTGLDGANLAMLVYRSRAVKRPSTAELHQLTMEAQSRNRRESLTGVLVYDDSRFFQWLEGPSEALERVMHSIRKDPRHTDIQILNDKSLGRRTFGSWSMKLATRGPISAAWSDEILEPSSRFMDDLRRHPNLAPATLVELVPLLVNKTFPVDQTHPVPLRRSTAAVLRDVILSAVIPTLADGRPVTEAGAHGLAVHPRVRELAELLIAPDQTAARELIEELHAAEGTVWPLYTALFEPAARDLGNLWSEDLCSEFDVTLGLSRMQSAARLFSARSQPKSFRPSQGAAVLIVPEPGEFHHLGAALDSEVLWNAGWAPRCEYPANDKALQDLLSATWFDALDVSLSAAFRRGHWLPRMKQTIAEARRASRNPALLVIVGGRVFMEHSASGFQVGADLTSRTALNVDDLILHGLAERDGDLRRA